MSDITQQNVSSEIVDELQKLKEELKGQFYGPSLVPMIESSIKAVELISNLEEELKNVTNPDAKGLTLTSKGWRSIREVLAGAGLALAVTEADLQDIPDYVAYCKETNLIMFKDPKTKEWTRAVPNRASTRCVATKAELDALIEDVNIAFVDGEDELYVRYNGAWKQAHPPKPHYHIVANLTEAQALPTYANLAYLKDKEELYTRVDGQWVPAHGAKPHYTVVENKAALDTLDTWANLAYVKDLQELYAKIEGQWLPAHEAKPHYHVVANESALSSLPTYADLAYLKDKKELYTKVDEQWVPAHEAKPHYHIVDNVAALKSLPDYANLAYVKDKKQLYTKDEGKYLVIEYGQLKCPVCGGTGYGIPYVLHDYNGCAFKDAEYNGWWKPVHDEREVFYAKNLDELRSSEATLGYVADEQKIYIKNGENWIAASMSQSDLPKPQVIVVATEAELASQENTEAKLAFVTGGPKFFYKP